MIWSWRDTRVGSSGSAMERLCRTNEQVIGDRSSVVGSIKRDCMGEMLKFRRLLAIAWRESRTARRRLLLYMSSISLGVSALVAIDSFTANVTKSVQEQSRALLGADVVLRARATYSPKVTRLLDSLERT